MSGGPLGELLDAQPSPPVAPRPSRPMPPAPRPSASPLGSLLDSLPAAAPPPRPSLPAWVTDDTPPPPLASVRPPKPAKPVRKTAAQLLEEERAKLAAEVWPTHYTPNVGDFGHNVQVPVRYGAKVLGEAFNTVNRGLQGIPFVNRTLQAVGEAVKPIGKHPTLRGPGTVGPHGEILPGPAITSPGPQGPVSFNGVDYTGTSPFTPTREDPRVAQAREQAYAERYADPRESETQLQAGARAIASVVGGDVLFDPRVPTIGETLGEASENPTLGMLLDMAVPVGPLAAAGKIGRGVRGAARVLANPGLDFSLSELGMTPRGAPIGPRPLARLAREEQRLAERPQAPPPESPEDVRQLMAAFNRPAPPPRLSIPEAAPGPPRPSLHIPEAGPGPPRLSIPEAAPSPLGSILDEMVPPAPAGNLSFQAAAARKRASSPLVKLLDDIPEETLPPVEPPALAEPQAPPDAPPVDPAVRLGNTLRNASRRLGINPERISTKVGRFNLTPKQIESVFAGTGQPEHIQQVAGALGMEFGPQGVKWVPPAEARLKAATLRNWDGPTEFMKAMEFLPARDPMLNAPMLAGQQAAKLRKPEPYRAPTFWDPGNPGPAPGVAERTQPTLHRPGIMSENVQPAANWDPRGRGPGPRPRDPQVVENLRAEEVRRQNSLREDRLRQAGVLPAKPPAAPPLSVTEDLPPGVTREIVDPRTVQVDAKAYQFKGGGDAEGVTERLRDVERWDPSKANQVIIHERLNGERYIADGHQRMGLARRLSEQGKNANMSALVYREADGFSVEDMRVIAAAVNLAQDSGTAIDAAKVVRAFGADSPHLKDIPRSSAKFRDGRELAKLSEPAFEEVVNGTVPPEFASHVGQLIADPAEQVGAMRALARVGPSSSAEARAIVQDIRAQGMATRTEQGGLFGAEHFAEDLIGERAKIFARAEQLAKDDKSLFGKIERGAGALEEAGNVLARDANRERITDAQRLLAGLEEAKFRGPVNDRLNELARELKAGRTNPTTAARSFLESVRSESEVSAAARVPARGEHAASGLGGVEREAVPDIEGQDAFFSMEQGRKRTPAEAQKRLYYLTARLKHGYPLTAAEQVERTALLRGEEALTKTEDLAGQGGLFGDLAKPAPKKAAKNTQGGLFDEEGQGTFFSMEQGAAPRQGRLLPKEAPPKPEGVMPAPYEVMGQKVQLGRMEVSRRLPMVGLVKLMRSWTGKVPEVSQALANLSRKMKASIEGRFTGSTGKVEINADLFSNEDLASKVLGHEIGHVLDMVGGPVSGQVKAMRSALGKRLAKEPGLLQEAQALSKLWRPFDEATATPQFLRYRNAPEEVIADYLSVFFNDAELAAREAPRMTQAFYAHLDKSPKLNAALLDAYDLLDGTMADFTRKVEREIDTSFARSEDLWKAMADERKAREASYWRRMVDQARELFSDKYGKPKRMAQQAENSGGLKSAFDPRVMLDEYSLSGNRTWLMARDWQDAVVAPLRQAGVDEAELGRLLFAERINATGQNIANPLGVTARNAGELLAAAKARPGYAALEKAAKASRKLYRAAVEDGVKAGVISQEAARKAKSSADSWAEFTLLEDLHKRMDAELKGPESNFQDVANPATATFMKAVATRNLAELNRARGGMVEFLTKNFPGEIRKARPGEVVKFGEKEFPVLEDGERVVYHADKWLADMFDGERYDQLGAFARGLTVVDQKFKALWITFNLPFQMKNVWRDAQRTTRSMSALGVTHPFNPMNFWRTLHGQAKALPHAWRYAQGEVDHLLRQMIEDYAIAPPEDSVTSMLAGDTKLEQELMRHGGLAPKPEPHLSGLRPAWNRPADTALDFLLNARRTERAGLKRALIPVDNALNFIRELGGTLEAVPKIAGYQRIGQAGHTGPQRARMVRDYVGTPNYRVRGSATSISNSAFLFSNIALQGWKADLQLATAPATRGAFWVETVRRGIMPKLLMAAAAGGAFHEMLPGIQEMYAAIPEYDKTNSMCIPFGWEEGGEYGKRVRYLRLPLDETSKFFAGMTWKAVHGAQANKDAMDWSSDIWQFARGTIPDVGPTAKMLGEVSQVAAGINPINEQTGRGKIRQTEFDASLSSRWKGYIKASFGNFGMLGEVARDLAQGGTVQKSTLALANIPGLNAFFRVSDRGFAEQQRQAKDSKKKAKAQAKTAFGEKATEVHSQYYRLMQVGRGERTPQQQKAYKRAGHFMKLYERTQKDYQRALEAGDEQKADRLRNQLEERAAPVYQDLNELTGRTER